MRGSKRLKQIYSLDVGADYGSPFFFPHHVFLYLPELLPALRVGRHLAGRLVEVDLFFFDGDLCTRVRICMSLSADEGTGHLENVYCFQGEHSAAQHLSSSRVTRLRGGMLKGTLIKAENITHLISPHTSCFF